MPDHRESLPHDVVTTIAARCRRCYNCVRSCPAKAIRVQSGQACVIPERCIGCGNCLKVCAQNAKQVQSAVPQVRELLTRPTPRVAILAPSYAAAYPDYTPEQVVAAVRALDFDYVLEVGFGAEMVAAEYARLLKHPADRPLISTACPALVNYIRMYMPELVPNLAPVVSPMVALGRAVKEKLHPGAEVVFIGPCVAKKTEIRDADVADSVDAVLTFQGLQELLTERGIDPQALTPSMADEPLPHYGGLFPVSGGLLKAAAVQADLMDDSIVVVEGPDRVLAALRDLSKGDFNARFLDALLCEGCIAGPAYTNNLSHLARRQRVTDHVRKLQRQSRHLRRALHDVAKVDVSRHFAPETRLAPPPSETEIRDVLARTNKLGEADELNCGACGYATCREKAIAVCQGLAEPEMCLPYLIDQLQINLEKLSRSKEEIARAREQAMRAQQLASMGQLTSDIAHEISSPVSSIAVHAQLLRDHLPTGDPRRDDVAHIIAEALHCRTVLASLQGFARQREPQWEPAQLQDIITAAVAEVQEALDHSGVTLRLELASQLPPLVADPHQLTQVLVNLLTNSREAMPAGGEVTIQTRPGSEGGVELVVRDTGGGIAPDLLPKVFQPFVSTKSGGGVGLGLAVVHGVVKAHGGEVQIHSKPGHGTEVVVRLPADVPTSREPEAVKVMVVDDDPDFLEQHRLRLEAAGFHVVTAERTDEALEVADREIPDAFVLDLMMERADSGARLSRTLRRDPRFRHSPIIMLTSVVEVTGFDFHRNPREVLDWMKADAWFDKPAPIAELTTILRRLLEAGSKTETTSPETG
jgi:iron only hydrogenase large subunit-like protein/nitrogen-specific signal transduction histidine kinase